ncbi:MAG TPA: nitrate reductase [Sulfurospirillum sp. UBA11407]|nr:MAG TPA: nitrate reductase [Sulfurospirillum sp. UBA11407]
MNVSSIVIQVKKEFIEEVVSLLKECDFCDYHFHDENKGKIIVTVEGEGIEEEMKKVREIEALAHVISADMMMSYSEDELDKEREKLELSGNVPSILNDENVKAEDIDYRGDLKRKL